MTALIYGISRVSVQNACFFPEAVRSGHRSQLSLGEHLIPIAVKAIKDGGSHFICSHGSAVIEIRAFKKSATVFDSASLFWIELLH